MRGLDAILRPLSADLLVLGLHAGGLPRSIVVIVIRLLLPSLLVLVAGCSEDTGESASASAASDSHVVVSEQVAASHRRLRFLVEHQHVLLPFLQDASPEIRQALTAASAAVFLSTRKIKLVCESSYDTEGVNDPDSFRSIHLGIELARPTHSDHNVLHVWSSYPTPPRPIPSRR